MAQKWENIFFLFLFESEGGASLHSLPNAGLITGRILLSITTEHQSNCFVAVKNQMD